MKTLYESNGFRIVEVQDDDYDMCNLKGDCYDPRYNRDINPDKLKLEEEEFEEMVYSEGVFGYVLEQWNPEVGKGYEHVDSCFGFIGRHSIDNEHYIVEEFAKQIPKKERA